MSKIIDIVKSSYLCIRFPFLYPRNRFTGKHYNHFKTSKKVSSIFSEQNLYAQNHQNEYYEHFGEKSLGFVEETKNIQLSIVKPEYIMKLAPLEKRIEYKFYKILNHIIEWFHFIPTYTELDGMPKGWRKRFGIQFCKELKQAILHSGGKEYMKEFRIMDIKEKWGELQVYIGSGTDEVYRVIRKYEYLSKFVCIDCGKDAVKQSLGWISPYCEDCIGDRRWIWINPIYGWSSQDKEKYNENILKEMP